MCVIATGSPPRRRGKVVGKEILPRRVGITPAWAGKSQDLFLLWGEAQDHPRVGREKAMQYSHSRIGVGSPPRRRGKVVGIVASKRQIGITPAWAGKRVCYLTLLSYYGDHPRMGGKKSTKTTLELIFQGSPPHGRGKAHEHILIQHQLRITPAWAGKSPTLPKSVRGLRDHPRVGGEK